MRTSSPAIIADMNDIRRGIRFLRKACPVMRRIHDLTGEPLLRRYHPDFAGLARIVTGQQLSIASAAAIWSRLEAGLAPVTPERVLATRPEQLAAFGLSRAKIKTLNAAADAIVSGAISLEMLNESSDDWIRAALTSVNGIGPWTADIYIMFCLGRSDAWAAGDLALQIGVAEALDLGQRLGPAELEQAAERWRPWRGVAARLILADYASRRGAASPHKRRGAERDQQ